MKKVLRWLKISLPFIDLAAEEAADIDDNTTGPDDKVAEALSYVSRILRAVIANQPIPPAPASLVAPHK